jgi:hypothetical protein
MSWATYEPMQSTQEQPPMMHPGMMATGGMNAVGETQQLPSTMPHQLAARPPVKGANQTGVKVPAKPAPQPSKLEDISEDDNLSDWAYIIIAVIIVEVVVICLTRFFPDIFGKSLNIWYNRFKLSAVLSDVFIILIGFAITRYVYTEYLYEKYDWNPLYFTGTTVVVQVIHDALFYFGIIRQIPQGQNAMIDVFKEYAQSGGAKIIAADSAMIASSAVIAMVLKGLSGNVVAFIALLAVYTVPYILETRNNFSNIV